MVETYFRNERREMLDFVPKEAKRVLEVGCGEGVFGGILRTERGCEVWGVELESKVASVAASRLDKALVGNIETMRDSLPGGFFDCVVFNDVLEHCRDPWKVLHQIRSAIADGGAIAASIPNVRFFLNLRDLILRKEWNYVDEGILDRTHLRFFTCISIRRLFEDCGFTIEAIAGINRISSWKLTVLNLASFGLFLDSAFLQFACTARVSRDVVK